LRQKRCGDASERKKRRVGARGGGEGMCGWKKFSLTFVWLKKKERAQPQGSRISELVSDLGGGSPVSFVTEGKTASEVGRWGRRRSSVVSRSSYCWTWGGERKQIESRHGNEKPEIPIPPKPWEKKRGKGGRLLNSHSSLAPPGHRRAQRLRGGEGRS